LLQSPSNRPREISPRDERRVAAVIRHLETRYHHPWALADLAGLAGLSPFHFLRVFRATAGQTPHQYLLRARLRAAAVTLATTPTAVTEVALACGFEDLSNFIRTFRSEFGVAPSRYRARTA
jgi:AraC-like DNA-binding protein